MRSSSRDRRETELRLSHQVLPEASAADSGRMARFTSGAQVRASVNHRRSDRTSASPLPRDPVLVRVAAQFELVQRDQFELLAQESAPPDGLSLRTIHRTTL